MATPIEMHGRLHGLARKVGKIGGEHVVYVITSHNTEVWNRLLALAEGEVSISLLADQGDLGLDKHGVARDAHVPAKGKRGRKKKGEGDATAQAAAVATDGAGQA